MLVLILINDYPFEVEKSVVDWSVSPCILNQEVSMSKENNLIAITFISEDEDLLSYKNVVKISYDNGNTFVGDFSFSFPLFGYWVGDPVIYVKNNRIYHAGVIYRMDNNNNIFGEIYFCSCNNNCHNKNNWSCRIIDYDSWAYFKDKPWIYVSDLNNIYLTFTSSKLTGYPAIVGYRSSNYGNSFENLFNLTVPSTFSYITDDEFLRIFISYNDFSINNKIGFGILRIQGSTIEDIGTIYFDYSSTTCPNFNRPAKLTNHLTAYNNKVAIAYLDDNCFLKVLTWDEANGFNYYNVYNQESALPMIDNYKDRLYIIFQSIVGGTIYSCPVINQIKEFGTFLVYSNNWGVNWSAPIRVSSVNYGFAQNPPGHDYIGIIMDNGYLYTAWGNDFRDNEGGKVFFTKSQVSNLIEKPNYKIKLNKNILIINSEENFSIYNVEGKRIYELNKGYYEIKLKKGFYFLKFKNHSEKIIIP